MTRAAKSRCSEGPAGPPLFGGRLRGWVIDCRNPPDELKKKGRIFTRWMIFGQSAATVDVSDGQEDILQHLPREKAAEVLALREAFVDGLEEILRSLGIAP